MCYFIYCELWAVAITNIVSVLEKIKAMCFEFYTLKTMKKNEISVLKWRALLLIEGPI